MNASMQALGLTLAPMLAVIVGAAVTMVRRPGPQAASAIQHFAAGVVFAAAASELLPNIIHERSVMGTLLGGLAGVLAMLAIKSFGERAKGRVGLTTMIGVDILVDGLVLGIGFAAGVRAGILLTIALTLELLFLALPLTAALQKAEIATKRIFLIILGLTLLLPIGVALGFGVGALSGSWTSTIFAFGLMALLYLVTEELLVEAHETPDKPWITAMFFFGFLLLVLIEELAPIEG